MSDPIRNTRFLADRLRSLGADVELGPDALSATGRLALSPAPFETLQAEFHVPRARFYTVGHSRLKFWAPAAFFDLPAVEVGRCDAPADLERALREAWTAHVASLREARDCLRQLGASVSLAAGGARLQLRLTGERTPPARVLSRREILLPSGGPLAEVSLGSPAERRYRPLPSLDHPSELELSLSQAMTRAVERGRKRSRAARARAAPPAPDAEAGLDVGKRAARRILALDDESVTLAAIETALAASGFEVDTFTDAQRALGAFQAKSYDLVLADAHMPRVDGLEFTARLQHLAGIERLPVVILDDRANLETRTAAEAAGASAYLVKPVTWGDVGSTLKDLLDHVRSRRYVRYPIRLPVRVVAAGREYSELTHSVARAGVALQTRREVSPGAIEHYRIELPAPFQPVEADGAVVSRIPQPGSATLLAGVRFLRILSAGESHWIRLIEELAKRTANAARLGRSAPFRR